MPAEHPDYIRAIRQISRTPLGRKYNRMARRRYGISGRRLAAKELKGESGFRMNAVSSAGARGATQFMPPTRAEYLRRYGVDAWKNPKSAIKAMELYQTAGNGIESYNPGDPNYARYILSQRLDPGDKRALFRGGGRSTNPRRSAGSGTLTFQGPSSTSVGLRKHTIPGQSFAQERHAAAEQLFLSGRPLDMQSLLDYKMTVNSLKDVPARTSYSLDVNRKEGRPFKVRTRGQAPNDSNSKNRKGILDVAPPGHKIIGVPYQGTHTLGNWQSDNAIDISLPLGTPIRIPRDAVVVKVAGGYSGGSSRFDGYQVTVKLKGGRELFYTHLSSAFVRPGERLRKGQRIGKSGAANGVPHLHLGASHGDPRRFYR